MDGDLQRVGAGPAEVASICSRTLTDSEPLACQPAPDSAVSTRGASTPRPTAITAQVMKTARRWVAAKRPSRPIGPRALIGRMRS